MGVRVSFYTDWFIADESEAEAIAVSDSHFDDWPSLSLRGIGLSDLDALWAIIRADGRRGETIAGKLLYQAPDGNIFVFRVAPAFIDALTALSSADLPGLATAWSRTEGLARSGPDVLGGVIRDLCAFAARATREQKPVLEMNVI